MLLAAGCCFAPPAAVCVCRPTGTIDTERQGVRHLFHRPATPSGSSLFHLSCLLMPHGPLLATILPSTVRTLLRLRLFRALEPSDLFFLPISASLLRLQGASFSLSVSPSVISSRVALEAGSCIRPSR